MRGRKPRGELLYDPEIEKTAKANRRAVRLARSAEPSPRTQHTSPTPFEPEFIPIPAPPPVTVTMGENPPPPPRPMMGDYGLATNRGRLTHVFQPANPVAFDIKNSVLQGLREDQYDGRDNMSPHEHISKFYET